MVRVTALVMVGSRGSRRLVEQHPLTPRHRILAMPLNGARIATNPIFDPRHTTWHLGRRTRQERKSRSSREIKNWPKLGHEG